MIPCEKPKMVSFASSIKKKLLFVLLDLQPFSKYSKTFGYFTKFSFTQVKRCPIIIYKHGIYQLSHELPNGFRLKDLWKLQNIRKLYKSYRMIAYFPVFVPK